MSGCAVTLADQTLELLPDHAVFWRTTGTLLLADLHLGKAASFRRAGLAVPEGDDRATLQRMDALIERWRPRALILLGDILHTSLAADPALHEQLLAWRERHEALAVTAIIGNHDRGIEQLEPALDCRAEGVEQAGIALRHHPPEADADRPWMAGHWHPVVHLAAGGDRLRLPAFVRVGASGLVLPAFGGLTGGAPVPRRSGQHRYVTSGGRVFSVD